MAQRIYVSADDLDRLHDVVDQHSEGPDAATAALLADELDRATVLADERIPPDVVVIGSRVTFVDERSGTEREVVLVYPSDADASARRVSVLAPVGAALLGLRPDDVIDWPLPGGKTARIRIRAVEPPHPRGAGVSAHG